MLGGINYLTGNKRTNSARGGSASAGFDVRIGTAGGGTILVDVILFHDANDAAAEHSETGVVVDLVLPHPQSR